MKRSELEYKAKVASREIVAIGFKFPWATDVVYEELENVACESDRFEVTADELYSVLKKVKTRLGIEAVGQLEYAVLWHSHPRSVGPSSLDIREFPRGVVDHGLVYHSPTGTTSRYDHTGELSSVVETGSRTTGGIS